MKKTYSVAYEEGDHMFVNGNTKFLKNMDQKDLAVLFKNGDTRVTEDAPKSPKAPKLSLAEPTTVATV